ncbi:MAG: hypothetical protein LBJ88_04150 [Campylobacteraceae bacterium]|jgi:hypothetical protein|nr:hypothetical protein [Campylobacteraceae bacterium]
MKNLLILLVLGALTAVCAQSGGDFGEIEGVISSADSAGKGILGMGVRWLIGLLPLILFVVGIFGGIKYAKRQADQDQDSTKIYVSAAIGGIAGSMVGLLLIALIGAALLGSSAEGLGVLRSFWSGLLAG